MGLSRKLGGSSKADPPTEVEYQWSTQCYTLKEIVDRFKVPRVVQCASPCSVQWSKFDFDLKQPLLIYNKRCVRKVYARNLRYDEVSQEMLAFGPPVIIPEDYDGWFTIVNAETDSLPRHTRIETMAGSPSDQFLVGTQLPVLIHTPGPNGEPHYVPGDVMPGEVLCKTGLCEIDNNMIDVMPGLKKGKQCLRCTDEKNDDLIIPFDHRAKMFEISDEMSVNSKGIVRINHVIDTGQELFPIAVRHMFGEPPAVAYTFTGDLKLERVFEEESLLASTLKKEAPFPLEIKTESKVKFCIALNESDIKRTEEYGDAFSACEELGDKYLAGMKVSFTVQPEMVPLDPLDISISETGSDAEDVDAQSEFVIDWDPDRTNSMVSLSEKTDVTSLGQLRPDVVLADSRELTKRLEELQQKRSRPRPPPPPVPISTKLDLQDKVILDEMEEEIV